MRRIGIRFESRVPGRYDLTVSICRNWRPDSVRGTYWRYFTVYLAILPVVYSRQPVHGRRWLRAWMWGRRGVGENLHLGPIGFVWTR